MLKMQLSINVSDHYNLFMIAIRLDSTIIFFFILQDTLMPPMDFPVCCTDTRHGEYGKLISSVDASQVSGTSRKSAFCRACDSCPLQKAGGLVLSNMRQKWGYGCRAGSLRSLCPSDPECFPLPCCPERPGSRCWEMGGLWPLQSLECLWF